MASNIDWSGYQIPGYMAAQDMRSAATDAGGAIGAALTWGLGRGDVSAKTIGEGIRGQGRSYFKDHIKGQGEYKNYDEWVQSEDSGRYLKLAEAGADFKQTPDGEWKVKTADGTWKTMGGKGAEEGALWDPYFEDDQTTNFESHMQNQFMGTDWIGGDYTYRTSMSPLKALFSKERYKPVANMYHEAAMQGLRDRGVGMENWEGLEAKGGLGWYPGKIIGAPYDTLVRKPSGALGDYLTGLFNKKGKSTTKQISKSNSSNQAFPNQSSSSSQSSSQSNLTWNDSAFSNDYKYGVYMGWTDSMKQEKQAEWEAKGITPESWKLALDTYKKNNPYKTATGNWLVGKLEKENLTIDPNTGELIPYIK